MEAGPDASRRLCARQVTPTITADRILSEDVVLKAAIDNEGTRAPVSAATPASLEQPDRRCTRPGSRRLAKSAGAQEIH